MLTLIIGAVVGLVVVAFIVLTENLGSKLYPAGGAPWRRLLIPLAGSLGTGFLLFRYFPNARGSGIPQTKAALFLRDGYISFRTVLGKFGLCSVSLASGIALGREGPSVQVGAGIASVLGRRLGLSASSIKALVPVGASAALAAAFNTPIAAVLFSLEEVMGDMHAPVLGSIVLSSATSWIVLHLVLGDEPLFHVPAYQLVHPIEFLFYAVLGLFGGLMSVGFVKLLLWQRKKFMTMPRTSQWLQPAVGGLAVGILGWFFPNVLGVGYGFVSQALNGQILIGTMALLVLLKMFATATCYASGNAGGIFGPSLFMGAMLGGAVGGVAHLLMPDYTGSVGAYALVGMGAAFAGVVRVPLTSVIMIFEITRDYSIIVPLMIANLVSYFISSRLQEEPIYEALQHQDGVHLPSGARAREALLTVGHAYRTGEYVLSGTELVTEALGSADRERGAWPVVDARGLRGMVTLDQLLDAEREGRGQDTVGQLIPDPGPVERLTEEHFPHLHTDHPLEVAMHRLAQSGLPVLPVVSRTNIRELKGVIALSDIVAAYGVGHPPEESSADEVATTRLPKRLLAGALAALIAVMLMAGFLNYYYRVERASRAERAFQAGNRLLLQENRTEEAIEQYRYALSISHTTQNRLALGLALAGAGRPAEAAIYLNEVLRDAPASGPANLGIARVYAEQGDVDRAVLHYQRAISGVWPEKPEENRLHAHLEQVQALDKAGRRAQAQAELLSIAATVPDDPTFKNQVGRQLIDHGLARNAASLFHDVAQHYPQNPEAWRGLGDAEFALADFSTAADAWRHVLKLNPASADAPRRIEECERILALDPTLPGLNAAERLRRSRELIADVKARSGSCPAGDAETPAKRATTEDNLAMAKQLWSACPPPAVAEDPLQLLMRKLTPAGR